VDVRVSRLEENMARDEKKQWRCMGCQTISLESEFLTAPSPFNPDDTLTACPKCLEVEGTTVFEEICDEPGCTEQATCGFPVDDEAFGGYRRTCGKHWREAAQKPANAELTCPTGRGGNYE
jgi:hypothetical protein